MGAMKTCDACGTNLGTDDLSCPQCGKLVYIPELNALSAEALALEGARPFAAARLWRRALSLVPQDAPQADLLRQRIQSLHQIKPPASWNWFGPARSLSAATMRTLVSLAISFIVYSLLFWHVGAFDERDAFLFGLGFVLLILVHEMGHVLAIRHYGMRASPPIFIPFVGAVISIPPPRNALEESIVGIGGPVLGTVGALVCFQFYRTFHLPLLLQLSFYGFAINLFNMLPVPPLDGGRITAAVTPWFWVPGLAAMVILLARQPFSPIVLIIIIFAVPRMWRTLRFRSRMRDYYRVGRKATIIMGASYIALSLLLGGMVFYTYRLLG